MTNCIRKGKFRRDEKHICFFCDVKFSPGNEKTCPNCNWKKCPNGHCACSTSGETKLVLEKFYDLFCDHRYSEETNHALDIMIKCYLENCHDKR